ncbi:MAG: multiprotein bridging factor aMBF1 [Candidatus Woesearchaeota archaeon]
MNCEMCGKDAELFNAVIEGIQLRVCAHCSKFGNVIKKVVPKTTTKPAKVKQEPVAVEQVVSDYAQRIKNAREKRNLTQKDFAKLVAVKESLIHKIETGHFEPPIELARKMEKILRITLVEVREENAVMPQEKGEKYVGMTIGDIIKIKQKS